MKLGATLYVKNSIEAVELYKKAFGLTLGSDNMTPVKYPDGTYLHAPLFKNGHEIFDVSEESRNNTLVEIMLTQGQRPVMTYGINFSTEQEVKNAFQLLSEGGRVASPLKSEPWSACSGEVVDKFGVYWYLCLMEDW